MELHNPMDHDVCLLVEDGRSIDSDLKTFHNRAMLPEARTICFPSFDDLSHPLDHQTSLSSILDVPSLGYVETIQELKER